MELLKQAGYDNTPSTMAEMRDMAAAVAALGTDENGNTIYGLGLQTKAMDSSGSIFSRICGIMAERCATNREISP